VACDIFCIITHGVGVEASISLGRDVIAWRQLKTTGGNLRQTVVVGQFSPANSGSLARNNPVLDPSSPDNDILMKREVEEKKLHRMAKVHNLLEIWQGSQTL